MPESELITRYELRPVVHIQDQRIVALDFWRRPPAPDEKGEIAGASALIQALSENRLSLPEDAPREIIVQQHPDAIIKIDPQVLRKAGEYFQVVISPVMHNRENITIEHPGLALLEHFAHDHLCQIAIEHVDFEGPAFVDILSQWAPKWVKVSTLFLRQARTHLFTRNLIRDLASAARLWQAETIVKTVESEDDLKLLDSLGVHHAEGKLFDEMIVCFEVNTNQ
jgi:EAL domain-containing protein (putative c-di-GMP-specific phosphodiesterase class I)